MKQSSQDTNPAAARVADTKPVGPHQPTSSLRDLPPRSADRLYNKSETLLARGLELIPGQTQSYRKRAMHYPAPYPRYFESGQGSRTFDVDGNEFIDFVCALGGIGLGHAHPAVLQCIHEHAHLGSSFSLPPPSEIELAEEFMQQIPAMAMVCFFKTGSDAVAVAVRLARAVTGRDMILTTLHHGWHDYLTGASPGIPDAVVKLTKRIDLKDKDNEQRLLALLHEHNPPVAAVVLAPPYNRMLNKAFLETLRRTCDDTGTLLIADEVVFGFRVAPGGPANSSGGCEYAVHMMWAVPIRGVCGTWFLGCHRLSLVGHASFSFHRAGCVRATSCLCGG